MGTATPTATPCPITVLLGAGASKDAGLRLAVELTQDLRTNIETHNEPGLQRALGLILGGLAFKRGCDGLHIDQVPDIETVVRVAELLADRATHPLAGYIASWHSSLERLAPGGEGDIFRRLIQRARDILEVALRTPEDATAYKYLAGVHKLGRPLKCQGSPSVFTLNYDLCLERALEYEQIAFTTGFCEGLWTPAEFNRVDILRLYKLHGSFGWVRDPTRNVVYDRDKALQRDDIDILGSDTTDELIFGTDNKLQALQPFLWMVNRFTQAVDESRYVVVIGYGFADHYINQIIAQGMASDANRRLIVVGPSVKPDDVETALGLFYYPERTDFLNHRAKEALADNDTIVKRILELEKTAQTDSPF